MSDQKGSRRTLSTGTSGFGLPNIEKIISSRQVTLKSTVIFSFRLIRCNLSPSYVFHLYIICIENSVTRFGDIPPLWQKLKNIWQYIKGLFGFGQSFQLTLAQFLCFWANLYCFNGQT